MPKIFYLDASADSRGMLRAVVPLADLIVLLSEQVPTYVGQAFAEARDKGVPCTLVEVTSDEERRPDWRAGFYRVGKRPLEFEDLLRSFR